MIKLGRILLLVVFCASLPAELFGLAKEYRYDLVVYGSTPAGIMAAVAASRAGLKVAVVDPGRHVGGMVAGGLSYTDLGNVNAIGGLAREFFQRVGQHYGETVEYAFEPHVATQVFDDMLRQAKVAVFPSSRLLQTDGVRKSGTRITAIVTENGAVFEATEYIDASYEGDLMVDSGVSNTWGRESAAEYGESKAGVIPSQRPDHQFDMWVSPYLADGSLLPGVSSSPKGEYGQGDKKIPAFNYRLCFTADKADQVPYPRPAGYNPKQYELLARYLQGLADVLGHSPRITDVMMMESLKGNKFDINNHGGFSTDDIGTNWDYPTANYQRRLQIADETRRYDEGFFYFLAHDPRVPRALQDEVNRYGLAKDEFTDTENWPWQLYVREDRRMLGEYVMTQHDILEDTKKPDSIGLGSYPMDSHNVQRIPTPNGGVENEGDMYVLTKRYEIPPYEIPYRSIVPKASEAANLLVPVCLSGSHVSYGTMRTEPVYMILGHAAGVAAAIAAREHVAVQVVPVAELQKTLTAEHAILHWANSASR